MKILMLSMMVPSISTVIPLYTMFSRMGLLNSTLAFVLPGISSVFLIWLILVFILVLIYQKKNIPLVRRAVFAGAVLFTLLCVLPVEQIIGWIPYNPVSG